MKQIVPLLALALGACAATPEPKEPPLEGALSLSSGPCLGFCPVYRMRLDPKDRYRLDAGEHTIEPGKSTGAIPVGSFRRALEALDRYDFASLDQDYTAETPENCPERITGTPTVTISRVSDDFRKLVTYDTGCLGFPEKDRLDQLTSTLRDIYRVDALIAVGEEPRKRPEVNETIGSNIEGGDTPTE